jgi:chemotaxis protein MotB
MKEDIYMYREIYKKWFFACGVFIGLGLLIAAPSESYACKRFRDENETLRLELEESQQRSSELEALLDMRNREISEFKDQLVFKNNEISEMQSQIDAKNTELQVLYDSTQMLENNVRELGDVLKARDDEMSSQIFDLSQQKQDLEEQIIALKGDIEAASTRNIRLSQLVDDYRKNAGSLTAENYNLKKERDTLKKTADDLSISLKASTDELSRQIADLTSKKQSLEQQQAELKKNVDIQIAAEEAEKERMEATFNQLMKSLEDEIEQQTVEILNYRDALTINIMDKIFFDSGKAEIKRGGEDVLSRVGTILQTVPDKAIRIEGHTDDIPIGQKLVEKYPTNWELGAARAANVAEFFRKEVGIDPKRMTVVSYSMYRPLVPHTTSLNRAKNRRIEIVVLDKLHYQMMEIKESLER